MVRKIGFEPIHPVETDLQSAAALQLYRLRIKLYTTDNLFVPPSLLEPFTPSSRQLRGLGTSLGILNQRFYFLLGYCAPRCFIITLAGQLLIIMSFSC